jgi:hypothetical protein
LRQLTSYQLSELFAYDYIQPIGSEREDLRSGLVAATIANGNRDPRSKPDPYVPMDFMPFSRAPGEPKAVEDLATKFKRMTGAD